MSIEKLSTEDKTFLATFTSLETLALNQTGLRALENFPANENLSRLELCENKLGCDELKHLSIYAGSLHTLKLTSNKFTTLEQLDQLVSPLMIDLQILTFVCFLERHDCIEEH
jgi:hypothetical protein